jgi:hypothetical protein
MPMQTPTERRGPGPRGARLRLVRGRGPSGSLRALASGSLRLSTEAPGGPASSRPPGPGGPVVARSGWQLALGLARVDGRAGGPSSWHSLRLLPRLFSGLRPEGGLGSDRDHDRHRGRPRSLCSSGSLRGDGTFGAPARRIPHWH